MKDKQNHKGAYSKFSKKKSDKHIACYPLLNRDFFFIKSHSMFRTSCMVYSFPAAEKEILNANDTYIICMLVAKMNNSH